MEEKKGFMPESFMTELITETTKEQLEFINKHFEKELLEKLDCNEDKPQGVSIPKTVLKPSRVFIYPKKK